MLKKIHFTGIFCIVIIILTACYQPDPPVANNEEKGDFSFSGYEWKLKSSTTTVGPGPNIFSASSNNVWLDANNMLHLKITKNGTKWHCSEVVSTKEFGYGTYIFTTASDLTKLDANAIFGLFTWNSYSFQQQANSEVDIEFSHWGNANDSLLLTYSVQPVWFSNPSPYIERTRRPTMPVKKLKGTCTHVFKWTPDLITWESYEGDAYPSSNPLSSWSYDKNNRTRQKIEGSRTSDPVVIPAPADSTNVRFNLWLLNGLAPLTNTESEVVIKSFRFIPL
ncbi:MAG: hypothetical protein RI894_1203 [Bacteroidota bacterium]|jgi:hypothetical protein